VFAAAAAEAEAAGSGDVLVWLDCDTVILREPSELLLPRSTALGYRPVMHNRSGSLFDRPPGTFWSRLYEVLEVDDASFFPMTTVADRETIRPYFNAGLLAVRPERGVLRQWATDFITACRDSNLRRLCEDNETWRIFIHQAALAGSVLNTLNHSELSLLPESYNYPMFFKAMYGAPQEFDSLEDVVTLRYDIYFRNPDPDWAAKLTGDSARIAWLAGRFGRTGIH
jgi:hypothetical protein